MKTKYENDSIFIDVKLYRAFKETFGDDKILMQQAIREANKAFATLKQEFGWVDISFEPEEEFVNNRYRF